MTSKTRVGKLTAKEDPILGTPEPNIIPVETLTIPNIIKSDKKRLNKWRLVKGSDMKGKRIVGKSKPV